ncbi:LCP family protein [uncultured Mycolicibacterium sp.]|uniref:LCP family protein n=1 Tax=uncultured Mycolicibacterium sp. TaxID=2320817 RepID=UPI0026115128|nr:LCP family protein [uncultured Mycolicibacterium sp.]
MSEGDTAAPEPRRPQDRTSGEGDNPWLTRTPRPSRGAAPWERAASAVPGEAAEAPGRSVADEAAEPAPTGNHTDGISVADLIARVSAESGPIQRRRRRAAEPEPDADDTATEGFAAAPVGPPGVGVAHPTPDGPDADTEVLPAVNPYDLPDLSARRPGPARIGGTAPQPVAADRTPRRNRRRALLAGRTAAAVMAASALVLTGGAYQWQSSKNNSLNRVSALDQNSRDIIDPNAQFGDENFLIVGVDSRLGENAEMGAGTTQDAAGVRSDTVILVNIPANRERVVAVSFPRDLAITPMKCEPWNPETGEYGPIWDEETQSYGDDEVYTETKLNSAYAYGGPKCLVKVIQKLSGLAINRFMAVDFAGFAKMVDAMGGVEVCTTEPLEDYQLGTVLPTAGRQVIDGATALNYVRARHVTTEFNGDYGRIKRQQRFLSSLLRQMISKEVFFSLNKLNDVVNRFIDDTYVDNIDTKDLVLLGQSIQNINAGRITFVTVPTVGYPDEYGNEVPRTDDMRALFDAIINDDPLPGERNPDNTPVPGTPESLAPDQLAADTGESAEVVDLVTTDPSAVTVRVSNSTSVSGLAASASAELEAYGFNVEEPDDYPTELSETTVLFSSGNEQAAATVASAFGNATLERVTGMGDTVRVVLGNDFATVQPPQPSGSGVQVQLIRGTHPAPTALPDDLTITNAADTSCD